MTRFQIEFRGTVTPDLWRAIASLSRTRACRTCDYGDSPECGHEERAKRVCAAPVGGSGCAALPCLGACSNPPGGAR